MHCAVNLHSPSQELVESIHESIISAEARGIRCTTLVRISRRALFFAGGTRQSMHHVRNARARCRLQHHFGCTASAAGTAGISRKVHRCLATQLATADRFWMQYPTAVISARRGFIGHYASGWQPSTASVAATSTATRTISQRGSIYGIQGLRSSWVGWRWSGSTTTEANAFMEDFSLDIGIPDLDTPLSSNKK